MGVLKVHSGKHRRPRHPASALPRVVTVTDRRGRAHLVPEAAMEAARGAAGRYAAVCGAGSASGESERADRPHMSSLRWLGFRLAARSAPAGPRLSGGPRRQLPTASRSHACCERGISHAR